MTTSLPLMESVLTPLGKCVLLPFTLSTAMSAMDANVQNNNNNNNNDDNNNNNNNNNNNKKSWIRNCSINNFKYK